MAICCNSCSAILGVTNFQNTNVQIDEVKKSQADLKKQVASLEHTIKELQGILKRR
jgi:peptidoglycan hydrolase CwlO-like protein